ncbi:MAG: metal ABC transporter permease [Phycisphaerales bacterium]
MRGFEIGLDLFPMLGATLAAVCCGVLGNFLVLRRLSLMGDAISHSVLPGLVIAFLIASTRHPLVMFVGAAIAGLVTVALVELVKRYGRVEPGAAMGVVFSVMFALGVLLIERGARQVDLDADCVLHGQLELLVWYGAPETIGGLLSWSTLEALPRQVWALGAMVALSVGFVVVLFKELRIAAFDPELATTQGFSAGLMHMLLMVLVAGATVASFEAVGSILVVAMLVCPAATARLLTDRLGAQVVWSVVVSVVCGVGGYAAATVVPGVFELESVNAAGAIAVMGGVLFAAAMVLSPRHGVLVRVVRRRRMSARVALDDLLAWLYRCGERGDGEVDGLEAGALRGGGLAVRSATVRAAMRRGLVVGAGAGDGDGGDEGVVVGDVGRVRLTEAGRVAGGEVVRRHRLWEDYLVRRAGLAADHVHDPAELLEHLGMSPPEGPRVDPHGRVIPGDVG